jgi:ABC-2 type transport system permease protein
MNKFLNILQKELRELITLRMVLPFIVTMLVLSFVGRMVKGEMKRTQVTTTEVALADLDQTRVSEDVAQTLVAKNFAVIPLQSRSPDSMVREAEAQGIKVVLVIPRGFEEGLKTKKGGELQIYSIVKSLSFTETVRKSSIKTIIQAMNEKISNNYIREFGDSLDPEKIKNPVAAQEFVVLKGMIAAGNPETLLGIIMGLNVMIPVILMMLIIFAGQMVASSLGQEKENKTLETILTVPVSRVSIVAGKMLAAAILAFIFAGIYMIGFGDYMSSFTFSSPGAPSVSQIVGVTKSLSLSFSTTGYLLLGVNIFLTIVCALSLATLLALFAEDTKSAQAMLTPLMVSVLIPYFFTLFLDPGTVSLPLKIFIYLLPFSHTFFAFKFLLFGNIMPVVLGIVYLAVLSAVFIAAAARIFSSDRVLTMKMSFGRKRRR